MLRRYSVEHLPFRALDNLQYSIHRKLAGLLLLLEDKIVSNITAFLNNDNAVLYRIELMILIR